ncbi:MAG: lamin tail domain-containing protein, partial [Myxococcales bacterium]|nr:lamin tail domain-containing protein [Myxococcales bacterium]
DTDADTDTGSSAVVILHEVLADPASTADTNCDGVASTLQDELVEIANLGPGVADLSFATLADAVSIRHMFPAGTTLQPGGLLVVYSGGSPSCAVGGQVASTGTLGLSNSGDTVTLATSGGVILNSVSWGAEGAQDTALTRDPQMDASGVWVLHTAISPEVTSPGTVANAPAPGGGALVLNEILADPGPTDGDSNCDGTVSTTQDEMVELYNAGTGPADLSGYTIEDATGLRHAFAPGTVVPAGGRYVVYGGGVPSCAGFAATTASTGSLGLNNGSDTVSLYDGTGTLVDAHAWSASPADTSMVRDPEGDPASAWVEHASISTQPHSAGLPTP